jgi:hypothetical protein
MNFCNLLAVCATVFASDCTGAVEILNTTTFLAGPFSPERYFSEIDPVSGD